MNAVEDMEVENGGESSQPAPTPTAAAPTVVVLPPAVPMPLLQQGDKVFVGPGAGKQAALIIGLGLSKLGSRQKDDLERAKRFAMDQSIKFVMMKQQKAHQENQQKIAMYAQALSLMSRVYIGSISFEVREEMIKTNFSAFGPIKNINMSWDTTTGHHKGFCFLEYEVPEAAQLAQESMNGKLVGGRNLKVLPVGRPANMPQAQPIIDMIMSEARNYNRIYVASVHPDLTEQDLRSVFESFGEITKCQLAKMAGRHRGFGYLEFRTAQAVKESIEGMNGFDLGGQYLQVGRAITPPDALTYMVPSAQSALPSAAAQAAAAVTAKIQALEVVGGGKAASPSTSSPSPTTQLALTQGKDSESSQARSSESVVSKDSNSSPLPIEYPTQEPTPDPPAGGMTRRRGFGGFAATVPPPSVVQAILPPPQLVEALPAPVLVVPPLLPNAAVMAQPQAAQPNALVPPPPQTVPAKKDYKDILSRIKLKPKLAPTEKATFAPLPDYIRPKDKKASEEIEGGQLMIGGPEGYSSNMELALRDGTSRELMKTEKMEKKKHGSDGSHHRKRSKKSKGPPKSVGPKLSTPASLVATHLAGAINDQMQAVNAQNDESTLASQEQGIEIRGNDARHLLMHKLMRTNRSPVIVLMNMVTSDGIDDDLEEEIREECGKFGRVMDVVIVKEADTSDVRIFVRYADATMAEEARSSLDKRFFDGRTIQAKSYDAELFEHNDFTG